MKKFIKILLGIAKKEFCQFFLLLRKLKKNLPIQYIYLTFDDGPVNGTKNCLSVCKEFNIKATFFLVGKHTESSYGKNIVSLLKSSSPQILLANHSYSHANEKYSVFYNNPKLALHDFDQAQQILQIPFKIVRLPGYNTKICNGVVKCVQLVQPISLMLSEQGFKLIGWDLEWNFNKHKNNIVKQTPKKLVAEIIYQQNIEKVTVPNHLILLMHDWMFQTDDDVATLREVIMRLQKYSNIKFETVDKYPQ